MKPCRARCLAKSPWAAHHPRCKGGPKREEWNLQCCSSLLSPHWSVKSHTLSGGTETPLPHRKASVPCWTSVERKTQEMQGTQNAAFFGNASILARQRHITWLSITDQAVVTGEPIIRNILFSSPLSVFQIGLLQLDSGDNYLQLQAMPPKAVHLLFHRSAFRKYLTWPIAPFLYLGKLRGLWP